MKAKFFGLVLALTLLMTLLSQASAVHTAAGGNDGSDHPWLIVQASTYLAVPDSFGDSFDDVSSIKGMNVGIASGEGVGDVSGNGVRVLDVGLPWETTYDCADWNTYTEPLNCDGLGKGGAWTCSGQYEQITAAANNPNGGGGKGQRHWEGDGSNQNSGGLTISFGSLQTEFWIRFYMRYELGFQWSFLNYDKILYIHTDTTGSVIPEWYGSDGFDVYASGGGGRYPCTNCGWTTTMEGATSDGQWHCYEIHIKMDTNGSDGVSEAWIDGTRILSNNNVDFGTQPGWTWLLVGSNQASPDNGRCMYVDFDDIAVSNTGYIGPINERELVLSGTPANQAIHLRWTITGTLPTTSTWQIAYDGPPGDQPSPIGGIISPTRAYTLTGLTNYAWYTVTLNAMSGSVSFLADTLLVMPTDIFVYLPLVLRGYGP